MSESSAFGVEVGEVVDGGGGVQGYPLGDVDAVVGEAMGLVGIVGQEPGADDSEVVEDVRAGGVVARIDGEPEAEVGVDGVEAAVLEGVGPEFVDQSDPAPSWPRR